MANPWVLLQPWNHRDSTKVEFRHGRRGVFLLDLIIILLILIQDGSCFYLTFTFPALNMLKMPARFLSFMAVSVPPFVSDLRIPEERLMVEWMALLPTPPPLLEESEPTLPLRILLRSSKGTSSGGEKPDLYRSITNRESCGIISTYYETLLLDTVQTRFNGGRLVLEKWGHLFWIHAVGCTDNAV